MNIAMILQMIQLGLNIVNQQTGGKNQTVNTVEALTQMIVIGRAALEAETGQPMDFDKLPPYIPV